MQLLNKKKQGGGSLRGNIAKRSASLLAVVAVAGGSAVMGMPQAHALPKPDYLYWEKVDQDGKPLGGSTFELRLTGESLEWANEVNSHLSPELIRYAPTSFIVTDNVSAPEIEDPANPREAYWNPFYEFQISDLDPRPGHVLIMDPLFEHAFIYNTKEGYSLRAEGGWGRKTQYVLEEIEPPSGYTDCEDAQTEIEFTARPEEGSFFDTESLGDGKFRHTLKKDPFIRLAEGTGQGWTEVTDKNFIGALANYNSSFGARPEDSENFSADDLYGLMARYSEMEWVDDQKYASPRYSGILGGEDLTPEFSPITVVGALPNCRVEGLPSVTTTATAEPSTVVTTTTQPPVISTLPDTTVTNPPVTVTNPGTTVTRPDTTITQPPVVSTIPGTTITKPGTTVTEPAKTLVTTLLGTTVREPGTTVREPGTTVREPDTTVVTTLREPDVTVTPDPVTVEKEKPVAVETPEAETSATATSETPVANETMSTTSETADAVPETSSNSNDARILASTGVNIAGFVAIAGLLIGIGAFAVRRRK